MTEKRFKEIVSVEKIIDTQTGKEYKCIIDDDLLELLNELHKENQQLLACKEFCNSLKKENEALKSSNIKIKNYITRIEEENRELEKFRYSVFKNISKINEEKND